MGEAVTNRLGPPAPQVSLGERLAQVFLAPIWTAVSVLFHLSRPLFPPWRMYTGVMGGWGVVQLQVLA